LADLKLGRLLGGFDAWAERTGVAVEPPHRFPPTALPAPTLSAPFGPAGITSIVWATGFRPDLSFVDVDVFDRRGRVVHDGGVTTAPGLYLMGMPFLRRRRSTLIDGAGADAHELAGHLVGHLDDIARARAS
jgi:putative flavoprotein involved in K+ transport